MTGPLHQNRGINGDRVKQDATVTVQPMANASSRKQEVPMLTMTTNALPRYTVSRAPASVPLEAEWDAPIWRQVPSLTVGHFHAASSDHRPHTEAKMVYDASALVGIFRVEDRYVVCANTEYQSPVYKDSCVEFFVRPRAAKGYFNFEMNCGGALLAQYIEDPRRTADGFVKFTRLPAQAGQQIRIRGTFDGPIPAEIADSVTWTLSYRIPLGIFEQYVGTLGELRGQQWRANFHKCADASSHPHWGAWAPIGEKLDFHNPAQFGLLYFE